MKRHPCIEPLERRELLAANLANVPLHTGETHDPSGAPINQFGGGVVPSDNIAIEQTAEQVFAGQGAYKITTNMPQNGFGFAGLALAGFGPNADYIDTRDLTPYSRLTFSLKNDTGEAFQLTLEIKDYRDSNDHRLRRSYDVDGSQWTQFSVPLDPQNGWEVTGEPDLSRTKVLLFVIEANRGTAVNGPIYLDEVWLTANEGALDVATAPIRELAETMLKRTALGMYGTRHRLSDGTDTGLLPTISSFPDVSATNSTAGMVKLLPTMIDQSWLSAADANTYVANVITTYNATMDKAAAAGNGGYLPPRYLDRITLEPNHKKEESPVDAAFLYLALYQYKELPTTSNVLQTDIENFLSRFNFKAFARSNGWSLACNYAPEPGKDPFGTQTYDGYSGEPWLISLAAHLQTNPQFHVDITDLYHSATLRVFDHAADPASSHLVHSHEAFRAPFLQWLFPLFVDVEGRGKDNYPDPQWASNPYENAVLHQTDAHAYYAARGRERFLQRDAGDNGREPPQDAYQHYSIFNENDPDLFMPWAVAYGLEVDEQLAGAALRHHLLNDLHGPLGLVDSVHWATNENDPSRVAARMDMWNAALAAAALDQYLYDSNSYLTNLPEVEAALDRIFTTGITVTPTAGLATTELGGTANFTIKLDSQPTANVTIGLTSSDTSEGTVSVSSVTFTRANWNAPQTVTVTGVDDDMDDGDIAYTITTAPATSTDTNYSGLDASDVTVTNTDDDGLSLTLSILPASVSESAGSGAATGTVSRNDADLSSLLVVTLAGDDPTEATVPATVTIPAGQASATFAIDAIDDALVDGSQTVSITASATSYTSGSGTLDVTDDTTVLTAPVLSLGTVTDTSVELLWTDSNVEIGYRILRDGSVLKSVSADTTGDTIAGLQPGTTYAFVVQAYTADDAQTADSDEATVTTQTASGTVSIHVTLVAEPTPFDRAATGENDTLPNEPTWVDEWSPFYAEIWVSTLDGTGTTGGSLDLVYDTEHFSAVAVEHGPAFDQSQTGTIDDASGAVARLGGFTLFSDIGSDGYALLARVRFESTAADVGVTHNAVGAYISPIRESFDIGDPRIELVGSGLAAAELDGIQDIDIWPMMYDIDDSGRVDFGDLAYFAAAFQQTVGDLGATYAYASDFDRSGKVDFGDLAFFAANFQRQTGDGLGPLQYPTDFPDAWQTAPLTLAATAAPQRAAEVLTETQLAPIAQAAIARVASSGDSQTAATLGDIRFEILDLPDNLLGRAVGQSTIQIDINAAAHGWFVDPTPWDDLEFVPHDTTLSQSAIPDTEAFLRVDLLTTVMHELSHLLGHAHSPADSLMTPTLPLGTRRLFDAELDPFPDEFDLLAEEFGRERQVNAPNTEAVDEVLAEL